MHNQVVILAIVIIARAVDVVLNPSRNRKAKSANVSMFMKGENKIYVATFADFVNWHKNE